MGVGAQHVQAIGHAAMKQLNGREAYTKGISLLAIYTRFAGKDLWVHHLGPAAGG